MPKFKSGPSVGYAASLAADAAKRSVRPAPVSRTAYIYALVDPLTHLVCYVGQTENLKHRYFNHCSGKDACTGEWVRSLPQSPTLVILQTVECKRVPRNGLSDIKESTVAETKWLKRFRRTIINRRTRDNSAHTWDWLVNPDE
jgi:predicted GIY-YIG superfamily endonuclease